jgi:hypothetical protein
METKTITEKQMTFIKTNKYYKVECFDHNMSFDDAMKLCDAISPYSDGRTNYHYRIRTKKEIWLPRLLNCIISLCEKYAVDNSKFVAELEKIQKQIAKARAKEKAKAEAKAEAIRQQSIASLIERNMVLNTEQGSRLFGTYLDGELEEIQGFDIVYTKNDKLAQIAKANKLYYKTDRYLYQPLQCYVENLDKIAYICYYGVVRDSIIGLVVSEKEYLNKSFFEAYNKHIDHFLSRMF